MQFLELTVKLGFYEHPPNLRLRLFLNIYRSSLCRRKIEINVIICGFDQLHLKIDWPIWLQISKKHKYIKKIHFDKVTENFAQVKAWKHKCLHSIFITVTGPYIGIYLIFKKYTHGAKALSIYIFPFLYCDIYILLSLYWLYI